MLFANTLLMIRPACFGFNSQTAQSNSFQNKFSSLSQNQIQQNALREFENLKSKITGAGVEVVCIDDTDFPVKPDAVFPNNWFLNLFNRSQALPDDVDDTVIISLIQNTSDSILTILHKLMIKHANATDRITKSIYKDYRHIPTYSTWFGNKMPIEIDFSVLSNALYFIYDKKVRLVKQDSATITLLSLIIKNNKHITDAAYISPQYARTPILLYHIARLLGRFNIAILDSLKPRLIKDCFDALSCSDNTMDSILLETSLMRLNALFKPTKIPGSFSEIEKSRFIFFIGTFTSMFSNPFKRIFMSSPMLKYYYSCPAYNLALLLENMVERRRRKIY